MKNLGWSHTGMLILVGIPVLFVWLARRTGAEYGISSAEWRTNLDMGMKAYLVRLIPGVLGWGGLDRTGVASVVCASSCGHCVC